MSFPRYEKYKDGGVEWLGNLPSHWAVEPLKRNVRLVTDKADQQINPIALENIESWSGRLIETDTKFQGDGVAFEVGDVLFGKLRPYLAKVFVAGFCGEAVGDFHVLRPLNGLVSRFAGYQLVSREVISVIDGSTFGAKMPRAGWEFLGGLRLAVPTTAEQVAIVAFLDRETAKIDALVEEQRRLIELLKEKRQALISRVVTKGLDPNAPMKESGTEWLGEVPAHWEAGKLGRLVSTRKGVAFKAEHFSQEGVTVVKASDIKNLTIRQSDTYLPSDFLAKFPQAILKTGEIILSTVGSTPEVKNSAVGQLGKVPDELSGSLLNQNTVVFSPSKSLINNFLFFVLQTTGYRDHLDSHAHGTANQASLNVSAMLDFPVPLPNPTEQNSIVAFLCAELEKMDTLATEAQFAIELLQERRGTLISAAVTGKIDVRGFVPAEAEAA
jgi:type I restriction enzyme S subunit